MVANPRSGTSYEQMIASFFKNKGLNEGQVAGILGNWQVESTWNPKAYNPRENAIGFASWEGDRRTRLQSFAQRHGSVETDPNIQLAFAWDEMQGGYKQNLSGFWSTSDPATAAAEFDQHYEVSDGSTRSSRVNNATSIYAALSGGKPLTGGGQTSNSDPGGIAAGFSNGGSNGGGSSSSAVPDPTGSGRKSATAPPYRTIDTGMHGNTNIQEIIIDGSTFKFDSPEMDDHGIYQAIQFKGEKPIPEDAITKIKAWLNTNKALIDASGDLPKEHFRYDKTPDALAAYIQATQSGIRGTFPENSNQPIQNPLDVLASGVNTWQQGIQAIGDFFGALLWIFNVDHFMKFLLYMFGGLAILTGLGMITFGVGKPEEA